MNMSKVQNQQRVLRLAAGLNEITRLAVCKGANPLTMGGLAGMGDLVLTCTGAHDCSKTCLISSQFIRSGLY